MYSCLRRNDNELNSYRISSVEFTIETVLPLEIVPGETDSIIVAWEPIEYGDMLGGIQVYADDPSFPQGWVPKFLVDHASVTAVENDHSTPYEYFLVQNFPNPFNPATEISFGLKQVGHVHLSIYNVIGQEVSTILDAPMNAGSHKVTFSANKMASGIYYYSIESGDFRALKKMVYIR